MRSLVQRLEKLEQRATACDCICPYGDSRIIHFVGDPPAQPKRCAVHGPQSVIEWPLPRSPLDQRT
jgi:hypothetical protein